MKINPLRFAAMALFTASASAAPVHFETNAPDGLIAVVSHPADVASVENEVGDDFVLRGTTTLTHATFTGLIPNNPGGPPIAINQVVVEIYRVFPLDSGPPSGHVGPGGTIPTRANSPADNAFAVRDSALSDLHFTTREIFASFTPNASIVNDLRVGAGSVIPPNGSQTEFDVTFDQPIVLPAGHYFFVPQVALSSNNFYWLSAPKPIIAPGTAITASTGATDIQMWVRNTGATAVDGIAPDWLRVGTDIIGGAPAPTFNGAFSLDGVDDIVFATNPPDAATTPPTNAMAVASHPADGNSVENEVGDDFVLDATTRLTHASFIGLLSGAQNAPPISVDQVVVEIYRVFPLDSGAPSGNVGPGKSIPTRTNSPSDDAFTVRDSALAGLRFTTTTLSASLSSAKSIKNSFSVNAGTDGAITGAETQFDVTFDQPIVLPAGHYFFVPQVAASNGDFYWLSSPFPIVAPGTPITNGPDIQMWARNTGISPDWLRVGTDIVGGGAAAPKFNGAFVLEGESDTTVHFATNDSDNLMAMATATATDIEAADDFVLTVPTIVSHATFTGLLAGATPVVDGVTIELYRIFNQDSDTTRQIPPTIKTRTNSPSDNAFDERDSNSADASTKLRFSALIDTGPPITAADSVLTDIVLNATATARVAQPVQGQKAVFDVTLDSPFLLQPGHYFFAPSVSVTGGTFYWLSSPNPMTPPRTPDLQTWMRDLSIAPDWLRVGTDIVGGTPAKPFNATFSFDGDNDRFFADGFESASP